MRPHRLVFTASAAAALLAAWAVPAGAEEDRKAGAAAPGGGTLPAAAPAAPATPAQETEGPALDPAEPNVVEDVLVATPAAPVTEAAVLDAIRLEMGSVDVAVELTDGATGAVKVDVADAAQAAGVADALVGAGLFEAVDYEFEVFPQYSDNPDDQSFRDSEQWAMGGFPGAGFDGLWAELANAGSASSVPIAVIDTGFLMSHRDRCANIVSKYDYGDGDTNVNPVTTGSEPYHGTATAGSIGACTNNGLDVASATWDQTVWVYKVAGGTTGSIASTALINAIRGAADDGAKVISMSLGSAGGLASNLKSALDYASAKGVVLVASSGNYGASTVDGVTNPLVYPAAYPPVISVGATDGSGAPASFSTYNQFVDLAAPGVNISLLGPVGTYFDSGTSFAAPLVAATAGMMLRFNPTLTPGEVSTYLTTTAHDVYTSGWDQKTGTGVLDAEAALTAAGVIGSVSPPPPTPQLTQEQILLSPDMDRDGHGEVVAVSFTQGTLASWSSSPTGALKSKKVLGYNFTSETVYAPGDWNGDGYADLMAVDGNGFLLLYPGNGSGYVGSGVQVGNGWTGYRVIPTGDLTSDGIVDLLAIDGRGDLYLYAGAGGGAFKHPYPKVGNGWSDFDLYAAGDLNGDKRNDIIGISLTGSTMGNLYSYAGTGGGRFATKVKSGNGWIGYTLAAGTDLNGDRLADIVGRNSTGTLYYYRGLGSAHFATKKQIGTGW